MDKTRLIWLDLEMTGLNPDINTILEIATLVTDAELNTIAEGPVIAIHHPDEILDNMDEWNTRQHGQSGLIARAKASDYTLAKAEQETITFLSEHVEKGVSPMCGNSICTDRRFLYRHMPALEAYFHYRHIDVSTLKELAKRWYPDIFSELQKEPTHLAMDDIKDSIDELKFYREHCFK